MPITSHYKEYSQLHRFALSTTKSVETLMRRNHLDRTTKSYVKKFHKAILSFQHRMAFLTDIAEAREDVAARRTISQEKLFKKLGL